MYLPFLLIADADHNLLESMSQTMVGPVCETTSHPMRKSNEPRNRAMVVSMFPLTIREPRCGVPSVMKFIGDRRSENTDASFSSRRTYLNGVN